MAILANGFAIKFLQDLAWNNNHGNNNTCLPPSKHLTVCSIGVYASYHFVLYAKKQINKFSMCFKKVFGGIICNLVQVFILISW